MLKCKNCNSSNFLKNKKAQTAETMTWIIATLVIIGILIIFVYLSVLVSKTKVIGVGDVQAGLQKESPVLLEKTSLGKIINDKNENIIESILNQGNSG